MSEVPGILCIRTPAGFVPASTFDGDRLDLFPLGSEIEVEVRKKRSGPRHRFYFAILGAVIPNLPDRLRLPSVEVLHDRLKMWLGYRREIRLPAGTMVEAEDADGRLLRLKIVEEATAYVPGSVSFKAMDDVAFTEFLRRALDMVQEHLIPGIDLALLKREAVKSLGNTLKKDDAA